VKLLKLISLFFIISFNHANADDYYMEGKVLDILPIKTQSSLIDKGVLPVPPKRQHTDVWCWASVTAMVGNFYTGQWVEDFQILSRYFNTDCYSFPQNCRRPGQDQEIQGMLMHFFGVRSHIDQTGTFQNIAINIDNGNPLIIALNSQTGGVGHVIVLSGYNPPNMVQVIDPMVGQPQWIPYQQLFNYGFGPGALSWTRTIAVYR